MSSSTRLRFILTILSFVLPLTTWARTPHSCYWAANKLAPDDFLPCYGSSTTAQCSCCQAGDKCLEGNACYDSNTGVTYQYGCTDSTFTDSHCPQKCNLDTSKSHWVGLIFCNGSKNLPHDTWVCHHPDNCGDRGTCSKQNWGDTIQRQPPTGCEDVKHGREYVALETVGTISDLVPLPPPTLTASWWSANADRYKTVATISIATSMPVPTTLITMTTMILPGGAIPTPSSPTSQPPTPTATEPPKSKPSDPPLEYILPFAIPLPLIFGFLSWLFRQHLKYWIKRAMKRGKQQDESPPDEKPTLSKLSDLWKPCSKMFKAVKRKLFKRDHENEHQQSSIALEPRPELNGSPVRASLPAPPESTRPTQWRVTNGMSYSPASTMDSNTAGRAERSRCMPIY